MMATKLFIKYQIFGEADAFGIEGVAGIAGNFGIPEFSVKVYCFGLFATGFKNNPFIAFVFYKFFKRIEDKFG